MKALAPSKPLAAAAAPKAPAYTPEQISTVQGLLNRLGYGPLAVNGTLDSATQAALTAFFSSQNIPWTVDTQVNFDTLAQGMRDYAERQTVEAKPVVETSTIAAKLKTVPKWVWLAGGALAVAWYVNGRMKGDEESKSNDSAAPVNGLDDAHVKPVKPKAAPRRKGSRLPEVTASELQNSGKALEELVETAAAETAAV